MEPAKHPTKKSTETAILVEDVKKSFKLPHERNSSLKSTILNFNKRSYETFRVLNGVSFEIKKGEFFGIVGRNGSGKSTLLKMLAGIYKPTEGKITVNGTLTPFIELGVGFNPELTGRENVYLNGAILGLTEKEIAAKYDEIVAFAELERFMDQKLKNYSSGMQVRLAFSIAIQAHNDILLIDEVLAVGDANFQRKCYQTFKNIKKSGKTVVFVTHDMGAVQDFCDRAIMIENSKIVAEGNPREVALRYEVANAESRAATTETKEEKSHRPSNPKVRLDAIRIGNHKKVAHLDFKDDIEIAVDFTVREPVAIQLNLFLTDKEGRYFSGVNTTEHLPKYTPSKGKHTVTCVVSGKTLTSGEYKVNAAIYTYCKWPSNEIPNLIDVLDTTYGADVPRINIINKSNYHSGLFNLTADWREKYDTKAGR